MKRMIRQRFNPARFAILAIVFPALLAAGEPKSEDRVITEDINKPNIDGNELARLFEKFTGQKVIVTANAAAERFRFVEEANTDRPIPFREAAELVRKSAILEDFVFVPHPISPKTIVLTRNHSKPHGCVHFCTIYNPTTPLPTDDSVITYVMELEHVGSKEALEYLKYKWDQPSDYAAIAAVPNAAAIVITDKVSNVRKFIKLRSKFDQPSSNPKTEPMPRKSSR